MITKANTDPVSARTGARERPSELPPRCAEEDAGAAVEEGEGDGVGAEASGATEPDALTLPVTPCHSTMLAKERKSPRRQRPRRQLNRER